MKEIISCSYFKRDLSALVACPTQTVCLGFGWLGTGHPTAHCFPLDYGLKLRLRVARINSNISSMAFTILFMPTLGRIFSFDLLHLNNMSATALPEEEEMVNNEIDRNCSEKQVNIHKLSWVFFHNYLII